VLARGSFCRTGLVRSQPTRDLLLGNGLWFPQSKAFARGRQRPAPSSLHAPGSCSTPWIIPQKSSSLRSQWQPQDMKEHDLWRGAMLLESSLLRDILIFMRFEQCRCFGKEQRSCLELEVQFGNPVLVFASG